MEKKLKFKPLLIIKVNEELREDFLSVDYHNKISLSMPQYNHLLIYCNQDNDIDIEFYHCDNIDELTEKKVNELINLTMQNNG